jgi:hypothetical protein
MKKLLILFCLFMFSKGMLVAQNSSGSSPQNITQEVKKEAEKLKSGGDAIKNGKKKAKSMSKAQKDALKKKKKSVNAKNAKKELDKVLK